MNSDENNASSFSTYGHKIVFGQFYFVFPKHCRYLCAHEKPLFGQERNNRSLYQDVFVFCYGNSFYFVTVHPESYVYAKENLVSEWDLCLRKCIQLVCQRQRVLWSNLHKKYLRFFEKNFMIFGRIGLCVNLWSFFIF